MAPNVGQNQDSAVSGRPAAGVDVIFTPALKSERTLARKAAKALHQPHKTNKQIVEDLLTRMRRIRIQRETMGLNHWEEFAPRYLQKMIARHEYMRRRAIEEHFRTQKEKALSQAQAKLGGRADAEDAVAEAYLKLLSGKSGPKHFNRVARLVRVDKIRKRANSAKMLVPHAAFGQGMETLGNVACSNISDGDPMGILLREETIREGIKEIKTKRKYQDSRRLKWWRDLLSHYCPEEAQGKEQPETNM